MWWSTTSARYNQQAAECRGGGGCSRWMAVTSVPRWASVHVTYSGNTIAVGIYDRKTLLFLSELTCAAHLQFKAYKPKLWRGFVCASVSDAKPISVVSPANHGFGAASAGGEDEAAPVPGRKRRHWAVSHLPHPSPHPSPHPLGSRLVATSFRLQGSLTHPPSLLIFQWLLQRRSYHKNRVEKCAKERKKIFKCFIFCFGFHASTGEPVHILLLG